MAEGDKPAKLRVTLDKQDVDENVERIKMAFKGVGTHVKDTLAFNIKAGIQQAAMAMLAEGAKGLGLDQLLGKVTGPIGARFDVREQLKSMPGLAEAAGRGAISEDTIRRIMQPLLERAEARRAGEDIITKVTSPVNGKEAVNNVESMWTEMVRLLGAIERSVSRSFGAGAR